MTDLEQRRQENLEAIQKYTLMDDTFMTQVFSGNLEATEYVLGVILKDKQLRVTKAVTQLPVANLFGRSVRLDIYATDTDDRQYDIEVQERDEGAIPERARLNSSLFDSRLTNAGQKYEEIPETYVIFITENDVLGEGLPIYNIERTILQSQRLFKDNAHIVYVNGAYRGNDTIGQLMEDFHCTDYKEMKSDVLAGAVRYYKEDLEGVNKMCDIMDRLLEKRAKEAEMNRAIESALRMIAKGKLNYDEIAEYSGLTIDKVRELASEKSA